MTDDQKDFLRRHGRLSRKSLTELFNDEYGTDYTYVNIKQHCYRLGIEASGNGRFVKGHRPTNTNMGSFLESGKKTRFVAGQRAVNAANVGEVRKTTDGYYRIKIAEPNKWQIMGRYVWEQAHGPLKKGECILYFDGDQANYKLENLRRLSQAEMSRINKLGFYHLPQNLKETAILTVKVDALAKAILNGKLTKITAKELNYGFSI